MNDYENNQERKNRDREFKLKVFQTVFGVLLTIGLLLAGYKILSVSIGIVNINFSHPDSSIEPKSGSNENDMDSSQIQSQPQAQIPDPEDFIRYYFDAITTQRNYEYLWSLQTDNFHREASKNSFNDYVTYWETVDDVTINSIDVYDQSAYSVRCRVKMNFYKNNESIPVDLPFFLTYDDMKNSWIFDVP